MSKDGGVASGESTPGASDVLTGFSAPTRTWFKAAFAAPTPAQVGAWQTISAGRNALVVAPTGSGKTLSAFLWSLDRLASLPAPEEKLRRCRVLYVSPLKALAVETREARATPFHPGKHGHRLAGVRRARHGWFLVRQGACFQELLNLILFHTNGRIIANDNSAA